MDPEHATCSQLYRLLIRLVRSRPPAHLLPVLIYVLSSPLLPDPLLQLPVPTTGEHLLDVVYKYELVDACCLLLSRGCEGWVDEKLSEREVGKRQCKDEINSAAISSRLGIEYTLPDAVQIRISRSLAQAEKLFAAVRKLQEPEEPFVPPPDVFESLEAQRGKSPPVWQQDAVIVDLEGWGDPDVQEPENLDEYEDEPGTLPLVFAREPPRVEQPAPPPLAVVPSPRATAPAVAPARSVIVPDHPPPYSMKVTGLPSTYDAESIRLFFEYGPDFYSVASSFKQYQRARQNPRSFKQGRRPLFPALRGDDFRLLPSEGGSVGAEVRYWNRQDAMRAMEVFQGKRLIARDGTCEAMYCALQ